ncbi:MAG: RNA 2',3'-cyclic phosphodiesterase [Steroidobacteraceae bacterium]|nr:RNA 2',3'-cyclic phosphodiesterase [Deltaproteobacteria bacterium]
MRLFIAIELPDDIKKALGRLRIDIPGARWVVLEQIHLTLAFLGEVDESTAALLTGELSHIHMPGFKLRFSGTGCFPDRRRPRVLWIGLEPEPFLNALAARVQAAVLACGIPQEEHPFSPHITLARLKLPSARESGPFLEQQINRNFPPLSVHEFILFQSKLTPQGALHTPIQSFSLAVAGVNGQC